MLKLSDLKSNFEFVYSIYEPSELILVGADSAFWVDVTKEMALNKVSCIDADENKIRELKAITSLPQNWTAFNVLVYKDEEDVTFYELSNSKLNGIISAEILQPLWRNIHEKNHRLMHSKRLADVLNTEAEASTNKCMVIECFGALSILKGAEKLLETTNIVFAKSTLSDNDLLEELAQQKLSAWLEEKGFKNIGFVEDNHPEVGLFIYVKDVKKELNTLNVALQAKTQENEKLAKKLETEKTKVAAVQKEKEELGKTLQNKIKVKTEELTHSLEQEKQKVLEALETEKIKLTIVQKDKAQAEKTLQNRDSDLQTLKNEIKTKTQLHEKLAKDHLSLKEEKEKFSIELKKLKDAKSFLLEEYKISKHILQKIPKKTSLEEAKLIFLAENAQIAQEYRDAIGHWQQLAASMSHEMPQVYYKRLAQAYKRVGGFPVATDEEEVLKGSMDKHEFLSKLHEVLKPELYLEIGVQTGKSLVLSKCNSIGIDPMPMINQKLEVYHNLFTMTSDSFFKTSTKNITEPIDLAFIDGMHLFEYALRDFINVEKYSAKDTVIVIDDIYPGHPSQAQRDRKTRAWTGDIWKLVSILKKYRKDLDIVTLDIYPTGLMIIRNLNSKDKVLEKNYEKIVAKYKKKKINTKKYIDRKGAMQPKLFIEQKIKG